MLPGLVAAVDRRGRRCGGWCRAVRRCGRRLTASADRTQPARRRWSLAGAARRGAPPSHGGAGRWITGLRTRPPTSTLPAAADPAPAFPDGLDGKVRGISTFRTPNDDFYRVDTRLTPADRRASTTGTLTIDGDVDQELTFTFDELLDMPLIERDITLTCVSNDVGGPYVGGARWLGVPPHRPARPGRRRQHAPTRSSAPTSTG